MKGISKKVVSVILIGLMLFGALPVQGDSSIFDGSQSGWAEKEILEAYNEGLTYATILNHYKQGITREEFCTIVVKLYEKLSGEVAVSAANPFKDTQNTEILKAFHLEIVKGTSATTFSPKALITRQEICVMIYRALAAANISMEEPTGSFPFLDSNSIAGWALEAVKYAYANDIMKGTSTTTIGPLQNTTREQAIVLLKRTYDAFSGVEPTVGTINLGTGRKPLSEKEKIVGFQGETSPFFNTIEPSATLYVSTSTAKPSSLPKAFSDKLSTELAYIGFDLNINLINTIQPVLPVLPIVPTLIPYKIHQVGTQYTSAQFSAFIDTDSTSSRWFSYQLQAGIKPSKIVYQVASMPFSSIEKDWKKPMGLISSGEISVTQKEFQIDFSKAKMTFGPQKPIMQSRKAFYVRVVPVDGLGNALGEPGNGLAVLAGKVSPETHKATLANIDFEMWTPESYAGYDSPEFDDFPSYRTETGFSPLAVTEARYFHFHDLPVGVKEIVIQVSTKPFGTTDGDWTNEDNILYEKTVKLPTQDYNNSAIYQPSIPVAFASIGKLASEMTAEQYTYYYVRGIALVPSTEPGKEKALYSQSMRVKYGFAKPVEYFNDSPYDKNQEVKAALPQLKIKKYVPIQWQDPESYQYYIVYKKPSAVEITSRFKNQNGEILYPFIGIYKQQYANQGIYTAADYETKIIPKFLDVGYKVYFPKPQEEDKEWYQQLYDGIVGFFKNLINIAQEITNKVQKAYSDFKMGIIKALVSICPVDSLKSSLQLALTVLVDSGMVAMGIPPELPNFSELLQGNMEYLASVALTEAGIPASAMTDIVVEEMTKEMTKELTKVGNVQDPNPINSSFLKMHPDYLYRPAYVELEVYNPSDKATVPGTVDLNVTFEMDYYNMMSGANGLSLSTDGRYGLGSSASWTIYSAYYDHFTQGLNGGVVDYGQGTEAIYEVFKPVIGQKIPMINPGQTQFITVYLTPFEAGSFPRYPEGENIQGLDFYNMYFSNGNKNYTHFTVNGHFPTPEEYLQSTGMFFIDPKTYYYYSNGGITYDNKQKSVLYGW